MFVPVILGSDKMMVSVATGQNDFHLVYLSLGNVHNTMRRAHRGAVLVVAFLPIPKSKIHELLSIVILTSTTADKEHEGCAKFRKFRRQLSHVSSKTILESLQLYTR